MTKEFDEWLVGFGEFLDKWGLTDKFDEELAKLETIKETFDIEDIDFLVQLLTNPALREEMYQKAIKQL